MKTKKLFILSFLMMMTMLLAGCSTRIEQNKISEATDIAENIKKAKEKKQEYILPEGYTQAVDAQNVNEHIILKTQYKGYPIGLTYDISNDYVELIDIEVNYSGLVCATIICTVLIILLLECILAMCGCV